MPARNAEAFVAAAVESVLAQTFADLELVVLDDASVDGTRAVLDRYADDRRVRVVDGPGAGLTPALNTVCAAARGEYLARMDADDVALPDRIRRQVEFLDTHPEVGAVGGGVELIDERGAVTGTARYPVEPAAVASALHAYNCLPHAAVTIRRTAFEACGGYRLTYAEDYDLWLRMVESWQLANLPDPVLQLRSHAGRFSLEHLEAQALGMLLVRAAAAARRGGRPDAVAPDGPPTRELVREWGISEETIDDAVLDALASIATQHPGIADERVHVAAALRAAAAARDVLGLVRVVVRHPVRSLHELRRVRRLRPTGRVSRS